MRISRVSATPSSVFRNEQQYLQAGDISHKFHQNIKKASKKKMMPNEDVAGNVEQKNSQQALSVLKDAYFGNGSNLQMRNAMSETALKLNLISKQQKHLDSYRSSI